MGETCTCSAELVCLLAEGWKYAITGGAGVAQSVVYSITNIPPLLCNRILLLTFLCVCVQ
jgi:hypothetical protein